MRIEYYERKGRVGIAYSLDIEDPYFFDFLECKLRDTKARLEDYVSGKNLGLVPVNVQAKGTEAIRSYAVKACRKDAAKFRAASKGKREAIQNRIDNLNIPLTLLYEEKLYLYGRVVKNKSGVIVFLEKPVRSDDGYEFEPGFYRPVFKQDGSLEPNILTQARGCLKYLYEETMRRREHGKVCDLVDGLNRDD